MHHLDPKCDNVKHFIEVQSFGPIKCVTTGTFSKVRWRDRKFNPKKFLPDHSLISAKSYKFHLISGDKNLEEMKKHKVQEHVLYFYTAIGFEIFKKIWYL